MRLEHSYCQYRESPTLIEQSFGFLAHYHMFVVFCHSTVWACIVTIVNWLSPFSAWKPPMDIFCDKRPRCCILICIRLTGMFSTDVSDMRPRQKLWALFCLFFRFSKIVALYLCFLITILLLLLLYFHPLQWHPKKVASPSEL